jgi:HEAT repeat protein
MSGPRKQVFGPLLTSALVVWALAAVYSGVQHATPGIQRWLRQWQLDRLMRTTDSRVRMHAISELQREDDAIGRPLLLQGLRDPSLEVRIAACQQLANRDRELPLLVSMLGTASETENVQGRLEVAAILGVIESHQARRARSSAGGQTNRETQVSLDSHAILCRLLKDESSEVRAAAVGAIGKAFPTESLVAALTDAAKDPEHEVRLVVAESLLKIRSPDDPVATAILSDLIIDAEPVADRSAVLKVLRQAGELSQREVIEALNKFLAQGDPLILPEIIRPLAEGIPQAELVRPALTKLLEHPDSEVRAAAATTIATLEGRVNWRVLGVMVKMVADQNLPQDQRLEALMRVQEKAPVTLVRATPDLVRQLSDPSADVRRHAIELLTPLVEAQPAILPSGSVGK